MLEPRLKDIYTAPQSSAVPSPPSFTLNDQQQVAYSRISNFLTSSGESFFRLKGYAGTGKTFLLKNLAHNLDRGGFVYTAPTNKATKVIRNTLDVGSSSCKTIYSLLGIKMVADNEFLRLEFPKHPMDLSRWDLICVDESSMLSSDLCDYIEAQAARYHVKFLFIGDPAQLQPVGEKSSPVWKFDCPSASLDKVERFDNELLDLATHIRRIIQKYPRRDLSNLRLRSNHGELEGVWKYKRESWLRNIKVAASRGLFTSIDNTKAIAWRNKTVDELNMIIRQEIHGRVNARQHWLVGDRILIGEPVQVGSAIIAHIDDEGTITSSYTEPHSYHPDLKTHHLTVQFDEGKSIVLHVIHEDSEADFQIKLAGLAAEAKRDKSRWGAFWGLRNDFHRIRYSYALTAHRAQGSTFNTVFVDSSDILSNNDDLEALRCLYVATTRSTDKLILS